MKINVNQNLPSLVKDQKIKALLLYGIDKGMIDWTIRQLDAIFEHKSTVVYSEVSSSNVSELLNRKNFFSTSELVIVSECGKSLSKEFQNALSKKLHNFPVFVSDSLPASCGIRKFFESTPQCASVACYLQNDMLLHQIVKEQMVQSGKSIDSDAVCLISDYSGGDSVRIGMEIEKLICYVGDKSHITARDVDEIVSGNKLVSLDECCLYFFTKNKKEFLSALDKLKGQDVNEIVIIRVLIKYCLNLWIVKQKSTFSSIDDAIRSLSPPIFRGQIQVFRKVLMQLSIQVINKYLALLARAELASKSTVKIRGVLYSICSNQDLCLRPD